MILEFVEELIWWRGPAPFVFAPVPQALSDEIRSISKQVTYGWGVIPVKVLIGDTEFTTALFPKNGIYLVPVKSAVQKAEKIKVGDAINVRIEIVGNG